MTYRESGILGPVDSEVDPGWRSALVNALVGLVPGWGIRYRKRFRSADGLTSVRGLFLSFVFAIVLIGVVVVVLESTGGRMGSTSESPAAVSVLAVGVASLAAPRLLRRPLNCDGEVALAAGYRQRFFLRVAFAEAAALVGFVGFVASSAGWLYPLGSFFTVIGFARLAPTKRHIEQEQDELRRHGCTVSLVSALSRAPEPS